MVVVGLQLLKCLGRKQILYAFKSITVHLINLKQKVCRVKKKGWVTAFDPAYSTEKGKSGGTAVAARKELGLQQIEVDHDLWQGTKGRATLTLATIPNKEPFLLCSVYLQVGVGFNQTNLNILALCFAAAATLKAQCLIGGDFNSTPQQVWNTGMLQAHGDAHLVYTAERTCVTSKSSSTIDFYICSNQLYQTLQKVCIFAGIEACLLYTSPSPRDRQKSRMPSSA